MAMAQMNSEYYEALLLLLLWYYNFKEQEVLPYYSYMVVNVIIIYSCWLSVSNGLIWAFIAPVIFVLVINTAMFIQALVIARKSLHKRSDSTKGDRATTSSTMTLFKGMRKPTFTYKYNIF